MTKADVEVFHHECHAPQTALPYSSCLIYSSWHHAPAGESTEHQLCLLCTAITLIHVEVKGRSNPESNPEVVSKASTEKK